MAAAWSADSKSFVTSSADCTVKLWDAQTQKAVTTWTVGAGVDHQQTGNTWNDNVNIVSLSLSGDLNVFDPRVGDKPTRVFSVRPFIFLQTRRSDDQLHLNFVNYRHLRKRSTQSLRLPTIRSSQEQPTVACTITRYPKKTRLFSEVKATRASSQALRRHPTQALRTQLGTTTRSARSMFRPTRICA